MRVVVNVFVIDTVVDFLTKLYDLSENFRNSMYSQRNNSDALIIKCTGKFLLSSYLMKSLTKTYSFEARLYKKGEKKYQICKIVKFILKIFYFLDFCSEM